MNQNPYLQDTPEQWTEPRQAGSNALGIVGFILCFCVPPVGLLLCLIALRRPPRGLAIAGTIIGGLGCLGLGVCGVMVALSWKSGVITNHVTREHYEVLRAVEAYQRDHDGAIPTDLSVLNLPAATIIDPWGNPYIVRPGADGTPAFICVGPDGVEGGADDLLLRPGMDLFEIGGATGEWASSWPPDAQDRATH